MHETESIVTQCVHSGLVQFGGNVPCMCFIDYLGGVVQKFGASCRARLQELDRDEITSVKLSVGGLLLSLLIGLNATKQVAQTKVTLCLFRMSYELC